MNKDTVCAVVRDLLPSYIESLTAPQSDALIQRHLAECEDCRAAFRQMTGELLPQERAQTEMIGEIKRIKRSQKRRKARNIVALVLVALIAAVCFLPLPLQVDKEVTAILWRAEHPQEGGKPVEVKIHGTYVAYLLRADEFHGTFAIEGFPITQRPDSLPRVELDEHGHMWYANEEGHLEGVGFMICRPFLKEFAVGLYGEKGWDAGDGLMLTWPATTREEAVETTRRVCAKNSMLGNSVWEAGPNKEEWEKRQAE